MDYIIEYEIAAVIVSLAVLINFFRKKTVSTKITKTFCLLVITILASSFSDILTIPLIAFPKNYLLWLNYLINIIFFGTSALTPLLFFILLLQGINPNKQYSVYRIFYIVLPFLIDFLLISTSPIFKAVFYFDENFVYQHGVLYPLIYIIPGLYILQILFLIIKFRKKIPVLQQISYYLFLAGSALSVLLQTMIDGLLIVGFINSICSIFTYLSLDNPNNYKDNEMDILNRKGLVLNAQNLIEKNKIFYLIGIHLSGLETMNETIGVLKKTELLRKVADTISFAIKKRKNLYRISGDCLVILIPKDDKLLFEIRDKLKFVFEESFFVDNFKFQLQQRATYLCCPTDIISTEDALDILENTLELLEKGNPGTFTHATKDVLTSTRRQNKLLSILKHALRMNDFYVMYQPIYSLKKKRFTTAEALIRLDNQTEGFISPEEFIPLSEKNGMILQIGEFVFESVCRFLLSKKLWELGIEYIHVNLSVVQCMQERMAVTLCELMDMYNLDYKFIHLEVTETIASASSDTLRKNMQKLVEKDIHFSLDDFGTGFSNTSSLINYPFRSVKLDKSLVTEAMVNPKAKSILEHTISMVKQLDMEVIAEGVESKEQSDMLESLGCDYIQGYYYSKPLTKEEFVKLLK